MCNLDPVEPPSITFATTMKSHRVGAILGRDGSQKGGNADKRTMVDSVKLNLQCDKETDKNDVNVMLLPPVNS